MPRAAGREGKARLLSASFVLAHTHTRTRARPHRPISSSWPANTLKGVSVSFFPPKTGSLASRFATWMLLLQTSFACDVCVKFCSSHERKGKMRSICQGQRSHFLTSTLAIVFSTNRTVQCWILLLLSLLLLPTLTNVSSKEPEWMTNRVLALALAVAVCFSESGFCFRVMRASVVDGGVRPDWRGRGAPA